VYFKTKLVRRQISVHVILMILQFIFMSISFYDTDEYSRWNSGEITASSNAHNISSLLKQSTLCFFRFGPL